MPTIFLTCFHSLLVRNVLVPVLPQLTSRGIRAVLVVPDYKLEYFRKTFGGPSVIVEGVTPNLPTRSFLGLFFKRLNANMVRSQTVTIQQRYKREVEGKFLYYYGFFLPLRLLGALGFFVKLVHYFDYRLSPSGFIGPLLECYRPDAVVLADVQNENDVAIAQCSRRRGIRTIGMVRSWDNLTQYGSRFIPDHLLVSSEVIKSEAMRFLGMKPADITVIGIPHYDRYLTEPLEGREEFFSKYGLNPRKKTIFFAPVGDIYVFRNALDRAILEALSEMDVNVVVRFPPNDTVKCLDGYKPRANVWFDRPGQDFGCRGVQVKELTADDDKRLMAAIGASDVVIAGASTILVDGFLLGRPAILLAADSLEGLDYLRSTRRYLDYDHIKSLVKSGAARVVCNLEEMSQAVAKYLADPGLDREARKNFVVSYCGGKLDGKSSRRTADAMLYFLDIAS